MRKRTEQRARSAHVIGLRERCRCRSVCRAAVLVGAPRALGDCADGSGLDGCRGSQRHVGQVPVPSGGCEDRLRASVGLRCLTSARPRHRTRDTQRQANIRLICLPMNAAASADARLTLRRHMTWACVFGVAAAAVPANSLHARAGTAQASLQVSRAPARPPRPGRPLQHAVQAAGPSAIAGGQARHLFRERGPFAHTSLPQKTRWRDSRRAWCCASLAMSAGRYSRRASVAGVPVGGGLRCADAGAGMLAVAAAGG